MIRNAIVLSFSLLMLPTLSMAECADQASAECSAKASETLQTESRQNDNSSQSPAAVTSSETATPREATTVNPEPLSSRNKKGRTQHQFPRLEPADPRDTVLSSEICVYSSASYTYTCR